MRLCFASSEAMLGPALDRFKDLSSRTWDSRLETRSGSLLRFHFKLRSPSLQLPGQHAFELWDGKSNAMRRYVLTVLGH
jgi:hypothetical protein